MHRGLYVRLTGALLFLPALAAAGCSSPTGGTVPVNGAVLFEDGKPCAGASIRFVPTSGGREASGYTGSDGTFSLNTFSQGDGAIPGEYAVVITKLGATPPVANAPPAGASPEELAKAMVAATKKAGAAPAVVDPVPPVYGDPKNTPLKWKVEPGDKKVDLKIRRT